VTSVAAHEFAAPHRFQYPLENESAQLIESCDARRIALPADIENTLHYLKQTRRERVNEISRVEFVSRIACPSMTQIESKVKVMRLIQSGLIASIPIFALVAEVGRGHGSGGLHCIG